MNGKHTIGAVSLVLSLGLAVAGIATSGGVATASPGAGSVTAQLIGAGSTGGAFGLSSQPGKTTLVAKVTFAPNSSTGWHTHPGKTLVVIQSGELTVYRARDKGCAGTTYGPAPCHST